MTDFPLNFSPIPTFPLGYTFVISYLIFIFKPASPLVFPVSVKNILFLSVIQVKNFVLVLTLVCSYIAHLIFQQILSFSFRFQPTQVLPNIFSPIGYYTSLHSTYHN